MLESKISLRSGMLAALLSMMILQGCGTVPVAPQATSGESKEPASPHVIDHGEQSAGEAQQPPAESAVDQLISVAAVGDIMLGNDFPTDALPPADGQVMLQEVAAVLKAADITVGNLEGALLDGGQPFKQCQNNGRCYVFRTPSRYVRHLADAGFDVMSLANNHARDFGEAGRSASMAHLDAAGIRHSGREGDVASWNVAGRRVAFIAFAPSAGSHDIRDIAGMQRLVADLAAQHDIVITSFHGGAEGSDAIHVPFATEMFHGEDRGDVARFARAAVEAGADLVLGHGPHVPRGIELHNERLIVYSLGNFATYLGINVSGRNGLAPIMTATLDGEGRFVSGHIHSNRQERPGGPRPDAIFTAARLMARVTDEDFTNPGLKILENGTIERMGGVAAVTAEPAGKLLPARVE